MCPIRGVQRNHEIFIKTAMDLENRNIVLAIGRKYRGIAQDSVL